MDATTYAGNGTSSNTINNADNGTVGFKPDLVWAKDRTNAASNILVDSVRGVSNVLVSNSTGADQSLPSYITSLNSNGFSVGTSATDLNASANNYVAWQWQAGQGTTSSNTNGSITSTVSVNATAGFSIVSYTGNGVAGATIGHGLGAAPQFIIVKGRTNVNDWNVYHQALGNTQALFLDTTNGAVTNINLWNNTSPTSSVITLGNGNNGNQNTITYVAYCWAQVAGFSQFGSYTGNNSADGPFIYTGFRPKFVLFKCAGNTSGWMIADTSRSPYNVSAAALFPNSSNAEYTVASDVGIDFLSNGIKIRGQGGETNYYSGTQYIYAAFAENPFKYANAR
jgi:hypothetical protein